MSRGNCLQSRRDVGHLFTCPACRADARMAHAWSLMPRVEALETPPALDDRLVEGVLAALRRDRARLFRRRVAIAAAAALLFFFCAGLAHETARRPSATPEESYASLASPSALEGLIPN